jgi:hypothetical protein
MTNASSDGFVTMFIAAQLCIATLSGFEYFVALEATTLAPRRDQLAKRTHPLGCEITAIHAVNRFHPIRKTGQRRIHMKKESIEEVMHGAHHDTLLSDILCKIARDRPAAYP